MNADMKQMKALVLGAGQNVEVATVSVPVPGPGEALIKVLRAGICNTDLEIVKGYADFKGVMGHEFVGRVEAVEPNDRIAVGQRVVGEINIACNNCKFCSDGGFLKRNHCLNRTVLGILKKQGTFAEYITLPIENLFVVPDAVSDEAGAFAEPLAAAYRIIEQDLLTPKDSVAIIGDGKLGLLIAEVLKAQTTSRLCLIGRHTHKMALIEGNIERHVVDQDTQTKFTNAFDLSIEASGTPEGVMMAAAITRPLGTVALKSTCAAGSEGFNTAPFVIKELNVIGSRCGSFEMAIRALETKVIKPEKLLTKVYPFAEAQAALKHAATRGCLKIQLLFE